MRVSNLQSEYIQNSYSYNKTNLKSPTFGIANSGELKTLFTYGLPCMYTGVEMIDPKKVQRLLNQNAFDGAANQVLDKLKPFEKSITDIEFKVYKIIKSVAKQHPNLTLQQILKMISPNYREKLKNEQLPVLQKISYVAEELPEDMKYKFEQFMSETEDKINEKPIFLPFSSYEFKYKLEKIQQDILQNGSSKANKVVNKLVLEASKLTEEKNPKTLKTQQEIMRFLKIILKSSVLKKNEQLRSLIDESQRRLNNEKMFIPFSRKSFIYDLNNLIEPIENTELKEKIRDLAISLPTSRNSIAAYITKFS